MGTANWGFEQIFILFLCAFLVWMLVRFIKREPQAFSKKNLEKSFYTMGLLALALIAFIAFGVIILRL
ncbi:MAG: hypothetical protein HRT87_01040 [Legionellales bacterium]|nr:hypothetical protein [Legionellales bacterium]